MLAAPGRGGETQGHDLMRNDTTLSLPAVHWTVAGGMGFCWPCFPSMGRRRPRFPRGDPISIELDYGEGMCGSRRR